MKQLITLIGLLAISVLYLFEVNYAALTKMNLAAFIIIALTIIYVVVTIVLSNERRKQKRLEKKQQPNV